jgi:hypothetical protein
MQSVVELPRPPVKRQQPRGGSRKGRPNKVSKYVKAQLMESLEALGGTEYLVWLGKRYPAVYGSLLRSLMPLQVQAQAGAEGLTIVVQQLSVGAAPVPGVITSPVLEHIAPPRLIARTGEVIDG